MPTDVHGTGLTATPRSRRHFLTLGMLALGTGLTPGLAPAQNRPSKTLERSLHVYNAHTGEHLDTVYWVDGHYVPEALNQLDYVLRDHHAHEAVVMDRQLFDLLYALA